jgi:CBS domain containing-hemolysin-like protein
VRYSGSAISYNVSSILGAAIAPLIAVWLWQLGDGNPWLVGLYLSAMSVLTFIALLIAPETKNVDYNGDLGLGSTGSL